jgi:hypothetical protein
MPMKVVGVVAAMVKINDNDDDDRSAGRSAGWSLCV